MRARPRLFASFWSGNDYVTGVYSQAAERCNVYVPVFTQVARAWRRKVGQRTPGGAATNETRRKKSERWREEGGRRGGSTASLFERTQGVG